METEKERKGEAKTATLPREIQSLILERTVMRALASNDANTRDAQVRKLSKWFDFRGSSTHPFTEDELTRIWKGLFYAMWMADKAQEEEELTLQLGDLVTCFSGNTKCSLAYFSAFMRTMSEEFESINPWSINKYLMLVRRMLRKILCLLKNYNWSEGLLNDFNFSIQQTVLGKWPKSRRLTLHYMNIFLEELAMVADGEISANAVNVFIPPFLTYMATQRDDQLVSHCLTKCIFHLIYQSNLGREFIKSQHNWKLVSPTDAHNLTDVGEDEPKKTLWATTLDPKAGYNMLMPVLPFDAQFVLDTLHNVIFKGVDTKRRELFFKLIEMFESYNAGVFPLDVDGNEPISPKQNEKVRSVINNSCFVYKVGEDEQTDDESESESDEESSESESDEESSEEAEDDDDVNSETTSYSSGGSNQEMTDAENSDYERNSKYKIKSKEVSSTYYFSSLLYPKGILKKNVVTKTTTFLPEVKLEPESEDERNETSTPWLLNDENSDSESLSPYQKAVKQREASNFSSFLLPKKGSLKQTSMPEIKLEPESPVNSDNETTKTNQKLNSWGIQGGPYIRGPKVQLLKKRIMSEKEQNAEEPKVSDETMQNPASDEPLLKKVKVDNLKNLEPVTITAAVIVGFKRGN